MWQIILQEQLFLNLSLQSPDGWSSSERREQRSNSLTPCFRFIKHFPARWGSRAARSSPSLPKHWSHMRCSCKRELFTITIVLSDEWINWALGLRIFPAELHIANKNSPREPQAVHSLAPKPSRKAKHGRKLKTEGQALYLVLPRSY